MANTSPGQLLTAMPFGAYPEKEWRDDLEWGATELALGVAGGNLPGGLPHSDAKLYLRQATHRAHACITGPNDAVDTLNHYDVAGLAHFERHRAKTAMGDPGGLDVTRAGLIADLTKQLDGGVAKAAADPFGFGFPWATFDTTTQGAGPAVTAREYDQLTHTTGYADYGTRWLGNILGGNAWGGLADPAAFAWQVIG